MRLPDDVSAAAWRMTALIACAAWLAGCTTSPTTGRTQFNILPGALETAVPDLRFSVKTMLSSDTGYCRTGDAACASLAGAERLAQRIAPIAERLGSVTPELSPELATRVPRVEVYIVPNDSPTVSSSAGGKIAVSSGLGRFDWPDTDLALALAREFGRLAAAHHRESTSAGLAVSLVTSSPLLGTYVATSFLADLLFPMGTLFKLGISLLGSVGTEQLVEASQQEEADEFAGKLLLAAGYDLRALAEAGPETPQEAIRFGWLPGYFTSRAKVAGMAPPAATAEMVAAQDATPLPAEKIAAMDPHSAGRNPALILSPSLGAPPPVAPEPSLSD